MAVTYCTVADVNRFFARNALVFDANTRLTATELETLINRHEDDIDRYINRTFKASVTRVGADGNGEFLDVLFSRYSYVQADYLASAKVKFGPIKSIEKLEVFRGGAGYQEVTSDVNNANRPNGIWFDPNGLEIYFGRNIALPYNGKNAVRIKYTAGVNLSYIPVPGHITQACAALTAAELVQSDRWSFDTSGSPDGIPLSMKAQQWMAWAYNKLDQERGFVWA